MKAAREQGIALITAMLIVAIVATVAAYLSMGQNIWLRQTQNVLDAAQADSVLSGATMLAAVLLRSDKELNSDHYGERWAAPLPTFPVESGALDAVIDDAQGRFNLNNLRPPTANPTNFDSAIFRRLLATQGLDPALTDAVIDWVDDGSAALGDGAEDDYYLGLDAPYRAANQAFTSVDELRLVKGFDAEAVQKLRPFVTVLPVLTGPTKININTAAAPVLAALFEPALDGATARNLADARDAGRGQPTFRGNPFKDCAELQTRAPAANKLTLDRCDIKTGYFEVTTLARFGRVRRHQQSVLARTSGTAITVISQRQYLVRDFKLEIKKP